MRNALTEIGEMIIGCNDKQWFLKPSLRAMINIGSPQDIVHTYAVLNGLDVRNAIERCMNVFGGVVPVYVAKAINTKHYQRSILSAAQVVMQSCCDEDLTLMVGGWKNGKRGMVYVPGRMPVGDIVRLASHLMEHGIIGKSPLKQPQRHAEVGKTTQEFHAVEYISSARGIYYEVGADVADLLTGAQQANRAFDDIGKSADRTSARLKNLDSSSRSTGKAVVRAANDSSQAAKTMEALGNEIAILEERNKNGARSAAILSAELRAGAGATAAQRKEIGQLTGQLYDMKNAQDQGIQSSSGLKTGISAIAAAISIGQIISYAKAFLTTADAMTQLQARIDRLVPSAEQGRATFQALSMIASQTGASLQDTAKLWEQLTTSLKTAGATNGQILALTETLQKIGRIGGSSSEEMANALRQFGQSIASGTIRAEEFNSILEQMPELARQIASGLGISVGELRKRMLEGKLSAEDALNAIMKQTGSVNAEFEKLPRTVGQATNSMNIAFADLVKSINDATGASGLMVRVIDDLASAIDYMAGKPQTASQRMSDLTSTGEMYARRAKTWAAIGLDGWSEQAQGISVASNKAAMLIGDLDKVTKANSEATKPIKVSGSQGDSKELQKLEKTTARKLELSKLEGEARARLQAQYDAEDAGVTDTKRIQALQEQYAAIEKTTSAMKAGNAEGKKTDTQQASINNKLEEMRQRSEAAATTTAEMSRQQTILRAQQSLGEGATQAQIQLAGEYAAKTYDNAKALRDQAAAEKQKQDIQRQFQQIQTQASPVTGLDNTFQQQMQTIDQYKQLYPQKIAEAEAARAKIEQQYRDQRMTLMWAEWQQQNVAAQLFGEMGADWVRSSVMGAAAQTSAIATTTAASVAGTATTTAASTAAAGTTMAAWLPAALVASIGSFGAAAVVGGATLLAAFGLVAGLSGKRKNGGPVTAGGMYQVGEGGMPEIYQASNGRQYMIPGDNGSVISNRDLMSGGGQSSGGLVVYNNVTNNSSANVSTSAQQNADGSLTISTFVSDMNEGGPMSQSIAANFATQRKATE
ncbi:hypothetical protein GH714_044074 [Hevea brasiliensis]|uniref:Tape measure protein N-terminal domain-containing protein n=1 Tax=Hevea brasiliensis TaxID=3981 RepID=A0A6A6K2R9_HEVBR|nr:hypothetical protein GH714_044074 [Hevea brasiliensis]